MNKRPDASGIITFFIVIFGIVSFMVFCIACVMERDYNPAAGTWWILLLICLLSFSAMFIINGFHNILLDIRDKTYEQTEIMRNMHGRFVPTVDKHAMISETLEDISEWKNRWYKRIEEQLSSDGISNAFASYLQKKIACMESIPVDEDAWYSNAFISYQGGSSDASDHISDMNTDLEKWKKAYIRKVNNSLGNGTITKEKANSIIAKVESCTEIPKSQK